MKYFSHKVRTNDGEFDSTAEYRRYQELKLEERGGYIWGLRKQVRFQILPQILVTIYKQLKTKVKEIVRVDEQAKHYTCDFCYYDVAEKVYVIEEVKSYATAKARDYPLRKHLIKQIINRHNSKGRSVWTFREVK
ncbi:MAG: DUF1064 domain-containing protein [Prevotella sp.]|nr:DUF1064 domain-containing protein [Prevotella sp.]